MRSKRQYIASALAIGFAAFLAGTVTGWFLEPARFSLPRDEQAFVPAATPTPAAPADNSQSSSSHNRFVARLHDALSSKRRTHRDRAITAIADGMSIPEIREALAHLQTIHVREHDRIRNALLSRWGELDPADAITYVTALDNLWDRRSGAKAVLGGWVENDPRAAEAWVAALAPGPLKASAMKSLVESLAISEPRQALTLAQSMPHDYYLVMFEGGSPLVQSLFDKWADDDPAAAAAAATDLPTGIYFRDSAMHLVGKRWAAKDLDQALAWAKSQNVTFNSSDYQQNALTGVVAGWLGSDPDAAIAWLNDFPDGEGKVGLILSLSSEVRERDPEQAMRLSTALPIGSIRESSMVHSTRVWMQNDPGSAAKWAVQQEDQATQRIALRNVAAQWMRNDPVGARDWIRSLPPDANKDTMLQDAIRVLTDGNGPVDGSRPLITFMSPEAIQNAAESIEQISDVNQRKAACTILAGKWLNKDREAARSWIESLPISDAEKSALLQAAPGP